MPTTRSRAKADNNHEFQSSLVEGKKSRSRENVRAAPAVEPIVPSLIKEAPSSQYSIPIHPLEVLSMEAHSRPKLYPLP